jgi:hypothetical protein
VEKSVKSIKTYGKKFISGIYGKKILILKEFYCEKYSTYLGEKGKK